MYKLGELNNLFLIVLQETFRYYSPYWRNKYEYNLPGGETGFDSKETKLPTYWNTPFSKICLGMKTGSQTNFIVINKKANSLYSLIADGKYRATSLGRNTWKKLIGSQASLQVNCNKEGFNAVGVSSGNSKARIVGRSGRSKARIGILGNNENDCSSPDSRIGFGGAYRYNFNTCGNEATSSADNGDKHIKTMGYILVQ